jgi:cytochrome c-type biogenesis protein CcmE
LITVHPLRRQRLYIVLFIVIGASIAAGLAFWALRDNMNFFYAPAQVARGEAPAGKTIRVGGLVVPGSLERSDSGLEVSFTVTDNQSRLEILYKGILPDLFAEGQGIIAVGELLGNGRFRAVQVLAKHDENYMPPEVHEALKAGQGMDEAVEGARSDGR